MLLPLEFSDFGTEMQAWLRAVPSKSFESDSAGQTQAASLPKCLFGFRNKKFRVLPTARPAELEWFFREGANPGERCHRT